MVKVEMANLGHLNDIYRLEKSLFSIEAYSLNSIKQELSNPNRIYLAATDENEKVLGYAGVNLLDDFAELIKIGVNKNFQNQGIAKIMLKELVCKLKQTNKSRLLLEVNKSNFSAVNFYINAGFELINTRKNYYKNGGDALIYQLIL